MRACGIRRNPAGAWITRGEPSPRVVQIAGFDPQMMADAARRNVDAGARDHRHQHGLPGEESLQPAGGIGADAGRGTGRAHPRGRGEAVTAPVTLKTRTGWDPTHKNGIRIARIAEDCGIQALAIHGRTRADMFRGVAEHDTGPRDQEQRQESRCSPTATSIRRRAQRRFSQFHGMRRRHDRPSRARSAMDFRRSQFFPRTGKLREDLAQENVRDIMRAHLEDLYDFYGDETRCSSGTKTLELVFPAASWTRGIAEPSRANRDAAGATGHVVGALRHA